MKNIFDFFKKHRKVITNIFTIVVVVLMIVYLYKNREVFESLEKLDLRYIFLIVLSQITTISLTAYLNHRIIRTLNKEISYKDSLLLQYANNFLNKIISEGGAVFRGYFLKTIYKLPYTKYISTIAGSYILTFLCYSIIGLFSLGYIFFSRGIVNYVVLLFFVLLFIGTVSLVIIKPKFKNKKNHRVLKWVSSILEGWKEIKSSKKNVLIFAGLILLILLVNIPQSILVYSALGENLGVFESLYMSSLSIMTTFINITPNSIGIREGVYMFSSEVIGLEPDIILLGSLINRGVTLITSFVLGGFSYLKLLPRLNGKDILKNRGNM